jgi:hypothetical protein
MPAILALLALVAGGLYMSSPKVVTLHKGTVRRFIFSDGSRAEHMSRLRQLFNSVTDEGNGVYAVVAPDDMTINMPEGARIAGVQRAVPQFHNGVHIGTSWSEDDG